ncbi:hypothetical protein PT2222_30158 [Paraburkholderia tropica]
MADDQYVVEHGRMAPCCCLCACRRSGRDTRLRDGFGTRAACLRGARATHRVILETEFLQRGRVVQIAAVEHDRRFQLRLQRFEIGRLENLPFGRDHQRVGAVGGFHRVLRVAQAFELLGRLREVEFDHALRFLDRDRVVRDHARAACEQFGDQRAARRFAHVVGVRLEGEAPETERAAREIGAEARDDLLREHLLLPFVDVLDRAQDLQRLAEIFSGAHQRLDVLREARAAVTAARVQEVVTDTRIGTDAATHRFDVRAHAIGEIRQFVHERDARGEHGVGRVLRELRRMHVHVERAFVIAVERRVQALHEFARAFAGHVFVAAQHDAVGAREVFHGRAFLQELGVRDHREHVVFAALAQLGRDRVAHQRGRADRHRRLVDDHLEARHRTADVARRLKHILQIRRAVFVGRRADGDELHVAVRDSRFDIGRKRQTARATIALDDFLKARLVNRHDALIEQVDLALVHVETEHVVADVGETRARHETHITAANDRQIHAHLKCNCLLVFARAAAS